MNITKFIPINVVHTAKTNKPTKPINVKILSLYSFLLSEENVQKKDIWKKVRVKC